MPYKPKHFVKLLNQNYITQRRSSFIFLKMQNRLAKYTFQSELWCLVTYTMTVYGMQIVTETFERISIE